MDKNKVYLAQSDTTIGFLCGNCEKLSQIKKRDKWQKILRVVDSFCNLKKYSRTPNKYKKFVRKSKLTTFIYPNKESFRVVSSSLEHHDFVAKFNCIYSTSANETKKTFSFDYAYDKSDIVVFNKDDFFESKSSSILKVSKTKMQKIR